MIPEGQKYTVTTSDIEATLTKSQYLDLHNGQTVTLTIEPKDIRMLQLLDLDVITRGRNYNSGF